MWPEADQILVALIDCDEATSKLILRMTKSNGFRVRSFPTTLSFLEEFDSSTPGCIVADFNMPERGGWELVDVTQVGQPGIQIVFLADTMDVATAVELMKAGVSDILLRPVREDTIRKCVTRAIDCDIENKRQYDALSKTRKQFTMLTPREREVFQLVVSGIPSREIAQVLDRSQKTVEVHRTSIMKKMSARSVVDLVRMGIELRVFDKRHEMEEPKERRSDTNGMIVKNSHHDMRLSGAPIAGIAPLF